jgi:hypothetical protein
MEAIQGLRLRNNWKSVDIVIRRKALPGQIISPGGARTNGIRIELMAQMN